MNRSSVLFANKAANIVSDDSVYPLSISDSATGRLATRATPAEAHSTFVPINYESGYSYPLVVWLHGPESFETEVQEAMPLVSERNYVAVAPRGTHRSRLVAGTYCWGGVHEDAGDAAQRVDDCIKQAQSQFNIHPERIFIAGRSNGGTLALRLAMEYPELCAGAISLGGRLPQGSRPLKRINECRKIPLMLSVSPGDSLPMEQVLSDLRLLHSAGFPLALRLYPEGDELTTVMLADMNCWIMEQFCPQSVTSDC